MYSALCDVISECVSYDLSAPDEVLSTGVGVSASSDSGNRTRMLLSARGNIRKCLLIILLSLFFTHMMQHLSHLGVQMQLL